jgi:hypothetical protein
LSSNSLLSRHFANASICCWLMPQLSAIGMCPAHSENQAMTERLCLAMRGG